jgi:hypothetical protein
MKLLGPTGFCKQVACIAATMHLANVSNLDYLPKNILYGRGKEDRREVALFDFDLATIDGWPPLNMSRQS